MRNLHTRTDLGLLIILTIIITSCILLNVGQPVSAISRRVDIKIDEQRKSLGETRFKEVKRKADDSECWKKAVSRLNSTCRQLTDTEQSRLAVAFANCHLQKSARRTYPCDDTMMVKECTQDMDSVAFQTYTEFFAHTGHICYFLQTELWQERTENVIGRLSDASSEAVEKLEQALEYHREMDHKQSLTLNNQETILDQDRKIASSLQDTRNTMNKAFGDMAEMAPWSSHSRREVIIKSHHREQQSYPGSPSLIYDMKVENIPKKVPNGKGLLGFIAQIGGWWHAKKLGLHLGLTDPQLSRIEEKHQQDPEERMYEMLVSWKRTKGAYATWRALARACREVCDLKLVDVVAQLASMKDMCDQDYPLQVPNDDDAETATNQPSPRASIVMSGEQAPIQESCGGSAVMKESTVIAKRGAAPRMAANDHEEPVDCNQLATETMLGPNDLGFVGRQLEPACSKWREIGLELMKEKPTFLDNFEEALTPQSCLLRMLQHWLRSDPVPTWEKILNALRSPTVRKECLATQIERKFCS